MLTCEELARLYVDANPRRENPGILPPMRDPNAVAEQLRTEWQSMYLLFQLIGPILPTGGLCECILRRLGVPEGEAEYICHGVEAVRPQPEIDEAAARWADYWTSRHIKCRTLHCRPKDPQEVLRGGG